MVGTEAQERREREAIDLGGGRGPDARRHRDEVELSQFRAVPAGVEKLAQRAGWRVASLRDGGGLAIESQQVLEHAKEPRPQEVRGLGKHAGEVGARPLEIALADAHRERHVRRRRFHAQRGKESHQVRVGPVVVDEEARVDWVGKAVDRGIHRVGVPPEPGARLEERDVVGPRQQPGGPEAGNPCSDDGDSRHGPGASEECAARGGGLLF